MARAHVKLLGPCFKTGRRGRRPTRDRDASRANEDTRYTSSLQYPPSPEPGTGSLAGASAHQTSSPATVRRQRFVAWRAGGVQPPAGPTETHSAHASATPRLLYRQPEPPAPTSRAPPFTTTQFHVLLNSLFKVLFNFPSRYLFAIGLGVIFSLTWSLPRTLSCTPKQLDSREKPAQLATCLTGLSPSTGHGPSQGVLGRGGTA